MRSEVEVRELLRKLEEIERKVDESYRREYVSKGKTITEAGYCLKCGATWFIYRDGSREGYRCNHVDYHIEFSEMLFDEIKPFIKALKWVLGEL